MADKETGWTPAASVTIGTSTAAFSGQIGDGALIVNDAQFDEPFGILKDAGDHRRAALS